MKNKFYFIFFFLLIDLTFSQTFLLDLLEKKTIQANKASFENRIYNEDYKYTFKNNVSFKSQYYGHIYEINTNDLGFRDSSSKILDRNKLYTIIIGDSFVEGVGLEYNNTLVGILNNEFNNKKNNFKFLNAGVSSYSSYLYLKKIKNIIEENNNLKIKDVIVLFDKSDVEDDEKYLSRPKKFENTKGQFINKRKEDFYKDLKELSFWRFFTKQTVSGKTTKLITDGLEEFVSNLKKRIELSKKFNKSFFEITSLEIKAIKSINNRPYIKDLFRSKQWENKTKNKINFAVENMIILKNFLDKQNINLIVVLYPWSFEIEDEEFRERYLNYIIPLLNKSKINTIISYDQFLKNNIYENVGKYFIYNDVHFNGNGYRIIAKDIAEYLDKWKT